MGSFGKPTSNTLKYFKTLLNQVRQKTPQPKGTEFDDPWDQAKHLREEQDHAEHSDDEGDDDSGNLAKASSPNPIIDSAKFGKVTKGGKPTVTSLYRHYKHSPHHPMSLALKYLVHRHENSKKYQTPKTAQRLDHQFMALHQGGGAGDKNGHIKLKDLHQFYHEHGPRLTRDLLSHQKALHRTIQTHTPWAIHNINGAPHVALTRGLKAQHPGPDHALASYADKPQTGFGSYMHHRMVPLKNVWFAFDAGHKGSTSPKYGNEDEFLVSPHNISPASEGQIQALVPREFHSYGTKSHPNKLVFHKLNNPDPNATSEIRHHLKNDKDSAVRRVVAGHPNTTPEILHHLKGDQDSDVRRAVAEHPNATPEILHHLKNDEDWLIRQEVADHPNTTPEILHHLKNDEDWLVRQEVARHPNATPEILHHLKNDKDSAVRRVVAGHPNTTPEILHHLKNDKDWPVRRVVAGHPNTTPEILHHLKNDEDSVVRRVVAGHPNTTPEILHHLKNDKDWPVRLAAVRHPKMQPSQGQSMTKAEPRPQRPIASSQSKPVTQMPGWTMNISQGLMHFNHGVHGTITIKPNPVPEHREQFPFVAVHGSTSVGRFPSAKEAISGIRQYTNTLTQPKTGPHKIAQLLPSPHMKKEELGAPSKPGAQPSPTPRQEAAAQISAGVNWSAGQKMDYYKQNLMNAFGMGKSDQYFQSRFQALQKAKPNKKNTSQAATQEAPKLSVIPGGQEASYNPKLERPGQRQRTKDILEQAKADPAEKRPKFSTSNSKLAKDGIISFNLPPIETCPGAGSCAKYCYADTGSFLRFYKTTMPPRVQNWLATKNPNFVNQMVETIGKYKNGRDENNKPVRMTAIRIHDSGDFYSPEYIDNWVKIAQAHPDVKMYAYTKSHHPALKQKLDQLNSLPNVHIVQSLGSKYDHLVNPDQPHAVIFPDKETMDRAGYADAMATDLTASDKQNKKIGLYIHGKSGAQYKGLEDHLKGHPELLRRIMDKLKGK